MRRLYDKIYLIVANCPVVGLGLLTPTQNNANVTTKLILNVLWSEGPSPV